MSRFQRGFWFLLLSSAILSGATPQDVQLQEIPFSIVFEKPLFERDKSDKRYTLWTEKNDAIRPLLDSLNITLPEIPAISTGELLVVVLNDNIYETVTRVNYNKNTRALFVDCAETGVEYKLRNLSSGKKWSRLGILIIRTEFIPSHIGMRSMKKEGLSEHWPL